MTASLTRRRTVKPMGEGFTVSDCAVDHSIGSKIVSDLNRSTRFAGEGIDRALLQADGIIW